MQDSATAHTANYFTNVLNEVFEDIMTSHRLWLTRSPDLNPCDFYLWGNLRNKVYSNNPHTHRMNLAITFVKQLYLSRSVNSN
jgi:hypothetical protein